MIRVWVVAISQKEANDLAVEYGHETREAAVEHLAEVQAPPTDPHYAQQYKIWKSTR